ncbi:hypothetical protein JCM1840_005980 [Sporobolomyces johnsonii]
MLTASPLCPRLAASLMPTPSLPVELLADIIPLCLPPTDGTHATEQARWTGLGQLALANTVFRDLVREARLTHVWLPRMFNGGGVRHLHEWRGKRTNEGHRPNTSTVVVTTESASPARERLTTETCLDGYEEAKEVWIARPRSDEWECLNKFPNLTALHLRTYEDLPRRLPKLHSLRHLSLDGTCDWDSVPADSYRLLVPDIAPNLRSFHLRSPLSRLSGLPEGLFAIPPNLERLEVVVTGWDASAEAEVILPLAGADSLRHVSLINYSFTQKLDVWETIASATGRLEVLELAGAGVANCATRIRALKQKPASLRPVEDSLQDLRRLRFSSKDGQWEEDIFE